MSTILLYRPPTLAQGLSLTQPKSTIAWEQTHGPAGGKVNVLLIDSKNPSLIYAGTDGGIYASRDGGATWQNSSAGLPGGLQVLVLTLNYRTLQSGTPQSWGAETWQAASQILYAGTNAGVYRSTDGGRTWSRADTGLTRMLVLSLAVDPTNTSVIYAGTDTQIFKSIDGGEVWSANSEGLPGKSIWSLVVDYATPNVLYAGTDSGVFKSTDGGQQWQRTSVGMPTGLRVQALVMHPRIPQVLYAATTAGVYRSADAAVTWQAYIEGIGKNIVHALVMNPDNTNILYAAIGTEGVWRSTDGGKRWEPTSSDINELVLTLAINPLRPNVIYAGTGRGVYYSDSEGRRWEPRNEGLINTSILLFAAHPGHPGTLYASTGLDVYKTTDYGQSWVPVNRGFTHPNVRALALDAMAPETVYAGTWDSEVYKSIDGGSIWRMVNGGLARDAPILALLVQPTGPVDKDTKTSTGQIPGVLYAGTNGAGVFISTDGGSDWTAINNGLDDRRVQVLAFAPAEGGILYAGTSTGVYHLKLASESEPGGPVGTELDSLLWQPAQQGLPQDEVKSIVVDERSPNVVYATTATGGGEIYRSTDGGTSWTAIGRGALPTSINIYALALRSSSRRRPNILYAGTDGGVFRSDDGGANWRAINDGLPPRALVLALHFDASRSYLYASISNSGVYRALDAEPGLISWPVAVAALLVVVGLATSLFLVARWFRRSRAHAQEQIFERNWPLWREEIQRTLQNQNEVRADALVYVPPKLRLRALQQYVQDHSDDNLVLRLNPPVLEPANSQQVWELISNWHAVQKRLTSVAAFKPVASRITEQLCQVLGFTLLDSRSYKKLHGFVVKAPALRLKMPLTFPIIFLQKNELLEQDVSEVRDLMGILNVSSYLALLIIPNSGTSTSYTHELKTRFKRLTSGAADDLILMGFEDLYRIFVAKDPERRFVDILLEQLDLTAVSPYVTSGPVPENMFFGRDHELKTITRTIRNSNFAIVGGRKIGKTSILTKLYRLFADSGEYYPLYLDCQATQDYYDFCSAVETIWKFPVLDGSPEGFIRLVAQLKQEHEEQMIVILLDEVDALLKHDAANQQRLFKGFRALSQEGQCRFICCGERVLHSHLHSADSVLSNFGNIICLSYLNPRDTGRIILEPMKEMGIGLEDASVLVQRIVDLSACHPNIVQYICQELITLINRRGSRSITLNDLEAIGNSNQFNEYLIEVMWGNATPLERLITLLILGQPGATFAQIEQALHEHGIQVPTAAIEQALDYLALCSVLEKVDHEYHFMALAFPSAIVATHDVPSLVDRMKQSLRAERTADKLAI